MKSVDNVTEIKNISTELVNSIVSDVIDNIAKTTSTHNNNVDESSTTTLYAQHKKNKYLQLYTTVKEKIQKYVHSNNGKLIFYVRLVTMFLTIIAFGFDFVNMSFIHTLYFLNMLVNSIKCISDSAIANILINKWITYAMVSFIMNILDALVNVCEIRLFKLLTMVIKGIIYYKLLSSDELSTLLNSFVLKTYNTNKYGINKLQQYMLQLGIIVKKSFCKEHWGNIKNMLQKYKN
jgi:hypothetical protein